MKKILSLYDDTFWSRQDKAKYICLKLKERHVFFHHAVRVGCTVYVQMLSHFTKNGYILKANRGVKMNDIKLCLL